MRISHAEGVPFSLLNLALLTTMIAVVGSANAAFIDKQNNSASLNLTNSWVGGVVPGTNDVARWRSIVSTANTTDLGTNQIWEGLSIANPGGTVTVNSAAGNSLTLGGSGVDMNLATRDLNLTCGIQLGATQTWTVGSGRLLTLSGGLGGLTNVVLTKAGSGGLIINETNSTFTGLIVVSNGFLGGTGVLSGPLLIAPGGAITPGNAVGQITVNNQLILQGTVRMEMSKGAGAIPADMVRGLSSVTYGGALIVSNTTASLLAEGDSVRLFAANSYSGAFTSMSLPTLNSWLSWDTSRLVQDGTIRVVAAGPPYIVIQPGNTTGSRGQSASFTVAAAGKQPLAYRWFKEGNALTSSTAATLILTNLEPLDAGGYQVVVSNAFGSVTSQVATLVVNLATLDSFNEAVSGEVSAIAVQADGKTLIGGNFGTVAGQEHANLARLNADGSVDITFKAEADGPIYSVVPLADGKILVAGAISELCGQRRYGIGRLNADGSLDQAFDPHPNSSLYSMAVQPDGRLVVAGAFGTIGGQYSPYIARLNSDGTADTNFNLGANDYVYSVALQTDGKILAGGSTWLFTVLGGRSCTNLGRLNRDGTLDTSFVSSANSYVNSIAVQADGKIVVGGAFGLLSGKSRSYLGRLNPDGSLDGSFTPQLNDSVNSVALQADGRILISGRFTTVQQQSRKYVARLYPDGSLDDTFLPAVNGYVDSTVVRPDGKVLIGGSFSMVEGQIRSNLACLSFTVPPIETLAIVGPSVQWLRAGSGPEFCHVSFDSSTNAVDWDELGQGSRVSGGWQWTGPSFPTNGNIRARGFATSGYLNGSSWYLEQIMGPPVITTQPAGLTNSLGFSAAISVIAKGSGPLSYQWRKDGVNLTDAGTISGSQTASLSLSNAWVGDSGAYSVVVTNSFGSVTSLLVGLTVINPGIVSDPSAQSIQRGQSVTFGVIAIGTPPLSYQWLKDGLALQGMTGSTLTVTNSQAADAGSYSVVVSNALGIALSAGAVLTVDATAVDSFNPNANGSVYVLAEQSDGKVLVGGYFTQLGGQNRTNLARLNPDGTLDPAFNPAPNGYVFAVTVRPDGKILIGGRFTSIGGQNRTNVACLDANGHVDASFNLLPSDDVYHLIALPDGKVLMSGYFFYLNGHSSSPLVRLSNDGSLDTTFVLGAYLGSGVQALALQPDGSILAGGDFATYSSRKHLARFSAEGNLDSMFQTGADDRVDCLAVQPDGRILVGGLFSELGGQPRAYLGRLNADGGLDSSFRAEANLDVTSLAVQADGKILVGGGFTKLGGRWRNHIGRLNADGTVDETFNPGADSWVLAVTAQSDGRILVGGEFASLRGQPRNHIGRLDNLVPPAESLAFDTGSITWLRSGSGPEFGRAIFEVSTNGADWFNLHEASRIAGGWQASGLTLPTHCHVRARGFCSGGYQNGSVGLVERIAGPPLLSGQQISVTNSAGTAVSFAAQPRGSAPFSYQWLKNGTAVTDQGNASGTQTPVIALTNLTGRDTAQYSVMVSNTFGCVTSLVASLFVIDPVITAQPSNGCVDAGQMTVFNAGVAGAMPMTWQWFKDGALLAGATQPALTLTNAQPTHRGRYYVVVSNDFGAAISQEAGLSVNFAIVDSSFRPEPSGRVYAAATQPDGKIVVGGQFNVIGGTTNHPNLARLNPDGTVDTTFNPVINSVVYSLALQPDAKILVGGSFSTVSGQAHANLCRLNPNGSIDASYGASANAAVYSLGLQPDNKILAAGSFTTVSGLGRSRIARLNADGSVDANFTASANSIVYSLSIQPDGAILAGGSFTTLNGLTRTNLGRLARDGAVDTNFVSGANGTIYTLVVQADGKVLVGGNFTVLAGWERMNLGRLNTNGAVDAAFSPVAGGEVYSLAIQGDGKILVAGNFTTLAGGICAWLGRLNGNGSLDEDWLPPVNSTVYSLGLQADGQILAGGSFTALDGQPCSYFGRIGNTVLANDSLAFDGTNLTWLRSGGCPEICRSSFDYSTNGSGWVNLGTGGRIAGGWALPGSVVPSNATIRVQGFASGGRYNGSAGLLERSIGPALVVSSPSSQTNNAETGASFTAFVAGSPPFSFQWLKDGISIDDSSNRSGTRTALLTLASVLGADAGDYSVIVTNATGCATSVVARLTVIDPVFVSQPASLAVNAGQGTLFSVEVSGTQPLNYQWFHENVLLAGRTTDSLIFTNPQAADVGNYSLIASNAFGCKTSSVASLEVNVAFPDSMNPSVIGYVNSALPQIDGKTIVVGNFTALGGMACSNIGRLNPDGSVDAAFQPGASGRINTAVVQPDGKILVGGSFGSLAGGNRANLGRLHADASLDEGFDAPTDGTVNALLAQPDGKILVGGSFTKLAGQVCTNLGRLTVDGQLDVGFAGVAGEILCLASQADGSIIVGGNFTVLGGQVHKYIGRMNTDGSWDATFAPDVNGNVYALLIQPDGRILVGGAFTKLAASDRNHAARLNSDGSLDAAFNPGANGLVNCFALQCSGKIIVAGDFTTLGGKPRPRLGRLNADGSLDLSFSPTADGSVNSVAVQASGKLLVGGAFAHLGNQTCAGIGWLSTSEAAVQQLEFDGTGITWLRYGAAPEVSGVWFEMSTNGSASWTLVGAGTRVPNGWRFVATNLPGGGLLRARGLVSAGRYDGSGYFTDSLATIPLPSVAPPKVLTYDSSFGLRSNAFGFSVLTEPGQFLIVQTSTNLVDWTPVLTNHADDSGMVMFSETNSGLWPLRFYRILVRP